MTEQRPDPDVLLAKVQHEESRMARGRLKIFFGMAPGVGKTYSMLEAARKEAKAGVDVVVGYVEPHARPETHALVMGLDLLPKRLVSYRGRTIQEFDLEAALRRKPQLILVDELAHTNAEGLTHTRRWQDIEDLLAAGIHVYTTLNVQHLESLNDVVTQVTSVPVRETVPDHVFERADEVELVDLSPDDLIERLRLGKVYVSEQALRAIENFFRKGNLIALRELALRKTADRVSAQAVDYRQQHAVAAVWPTADRLLVCVGPSPMSARLVRATRRIAATLRAPWTALHIELDHSKELSPEDRQRLEDNLRLAEQLGAQLEHVSGANFADCVLNVCRERNMTRIIVGKPQQSRWIEFRRGAFVYDLIRRCGNIDVYVISGDEDTASPGRTEVQRKPVAKSPVLISMGAVAVCTAISWLLSRVLEPTNLAMIYLATVVAVALTLGRIPSVIATVLSVLTFDVCFVPPFGKLAVSDSQYLVTFAVMLATGLIVSELSERIRWQTLAARERQRRTAALLSLSRELSDHPTPDGIMQSAKRILEDVFDADIGILCRTEFSNNSLSPDSGVARWVFEHRQIAGAGTATLPGSEWLYLPLLNGEHNAGVLGLKTRSSSRSLDRLQLQLLEAFASQIAAALERCSLAADGEKIRLQAETERLRNSLLSAVSHDLRTPLATLTGAASILVDRGELLSVDSRKELAESMLDESDRLHRLVQNLLDLTRLEAGAIRLRRELQPIEEVIGVVLHRLERQLRNHPLQLHVANDLPPVMIDELLMQQVLINLLDNAAKFAPPGTAIELHAEARGQFLVLEICDHGPGIVPGEEDRIFERFFRGSEQQTSGSGIGLAICRAVIQLHGGTISAENRSGGGAVIRFSLPVENTSRPIEGTATQHV